MKSRSMVPGRFNGTNFHGQGTWPYQVDVTEAIQPGKDMPQIEIIQSWCNRQAGDACQPTGTPSTRVPHDPFESVAMFQTSGLLGPVSLQAFGANRSPSGWTACFHTPDNWLERGCPAAS
jgi:hypothetical protein